MTTELRPRRGAAERVTGVIWGAIVAASGACAIAALSGYDVDLQLIAIIALAALGAWLVVSAVVLATRQSRQERARADAAAMPAPEPAPEPDAEPEPEDREDS
ncbi:hypothetical protein [Demequina subtropica]|uniref:hypothetical protein n=1 Tax=Demequina subtropica TaxID=1638989 RepID=UPI0007847AA8|nr:hypothetical protein [Demequina subtropica]